MDPTIRTRQDWNRAVQELCESPTSSLQIELEDLQDEVFGRLLLQDDIDHLSTALLAFVGRKRRVWEGFS